MPYKWLATFGLGSEFFRRAFARLTKFLGCLEVPCGFVVELAPEFTYCTTELMGSESPWLVVAYTEMAAKTAAYILFNLYDSCRIWALSHDMSEGISRFNL